MCRNITILRGLEPAATAEEIEAAARQYVRKVSGVQSVSAASEEPFELAVRRVTEATDRPAALAAATPPAADDGAAAAPPAQHGLTSRRRQAGELGRGAASALRTRRSSLPVSLYGSSARNSTRAGTFDERSRSRT